MKNIKFKQYTKPISKTNFGYNVDGAYFRTKGKARKYTQHLASKQQKLRDMQNFEIFKDKNSARRRKNSTQAALITQGLTTGQAVNQRILDDDNVNQSLSTSINDQKDKEESKGKGDSSSIIDWL